MTLHVTPVEALWLVTSGLAVLVTLIALLDALSDRRDTRLVNGPARSLATQANVEQERLRLITALLLLSVVIPGLVVDRPTALVNPDGWPNLPLLALIAVPVVILLAALRAAHARQRLAAMSLSAIEAERTPVLAALDEIKVQVTTETEAATAAAKRAELVASAGAARAEEGAASARAAYTEATRVNAKLAAQDEMRETLDDTHRLTAEVHERVVEKDAGS